MTKIYQVQSNVRHNGDSYVKGTLLSSDESFDQLVSDGLFKVIEGAETIEEAKKIVEEEKELESMENESGDVAQANTWEPQKESKPEESTEPKNETAEKKESKGFLGGIFGGKKDDATEPYTGPMSQYKITGIAPFLNEKGEQEGLHDIGTVQTLPTEIGDVFVTDGVAEKVDETVDASANTNAGIVPSEDGSNL